MAHDLTFDANANEYAMFCAGQPAWHNLGQNVANAQTWQDAIKLAHLDFTLVDAPLYTQWSKAGLLAVPSHKAITRLDTKQTIGVVGKDFQTIQPAEAFKFCDTLVESSGAHYVSAGLLSDGARMWVLLRVPSADISVGDDKTETYLLFAQGFDGSMALTSRITGTRVVCQNTLSAALNVGGFALKIKHTSGAKDRLASAGKLIENVQQNAKSLEAKLRLLASRKLTKDTFVTILDKLFPKNENTERQTRRDNILATVTALFESNDKNAFPEQRGTAYNLLNAITNYADHEKSAKANGHTVEFKRAESALFGTGAQLKDSALAVIDAVTAGCEVKTHLTEEEETEQLSKAFNLTGDNPLKAFGTL